MNDILITTVAGPDLGARIAAADALAGAAFCRIVIPPGDYTISTQIVLSDNRHVHFGAGVYENNTPAESILFGHNTTISGNGAATILKQSSAADHPTNIPAYKLFATKYYHAGLFEGSQNVTFTDFRIQGQDAVVGSSSPGAIDISNGANTIIERVYFDHCKCFGIALGGTSSTGHYCFNTKILACTFDQTFYEGIAAVNADTLIIQGNILIAGEWAVGIDLEANEITDRLQNFDISHNLFDHREQATTSGGDIDINGSGAGIPRVGPGIVSGNVCIGADLHLDFVEGGTSAINIFDAHDVVVSDNHISGYLSGGIMVVGLAMPTTRCRVTGNTIEGCGGAVRLQGDVTYCVVDGNRGQGNQMTGFGSPDASILEEAIDAATPDHNLFLRNVLRNDWSVPTITLLGANSKRWGNTLNERQYEGALAVAEGTAAPTSGTWAVGDKVRNTAPAEAGSSGSKYTVAGWVCTAGGTPGTWLEMRSLTGN
jgi:hypothetical protein